MKRIAATLSLLLIFCTTYAQSYRIQKASAFVKVSTPGMIFRDESGNTVQPEPIIERFIYLECSSGVKPSIDSVFYNGTLFSASIAKTGETSVDIGIKKENGLPVKLTPKKGNQLWKIELQQSTDKPLRPELVKKIIIKGMLDKQKFCYTVLTETELSTPDRY